MMRPWITLPVACAVACLAAPAHAGLVKNEWQTVNTMLQPYVEQQVLNQVTQAVTQADGATEDAVDPLQEVLDYLDTVEACANKPTDEIVDCIRAAVAPNDYVCVKAMAGSPSSSDQIPGPRPDGGTHFAVDTRVSYDGDAHRLNNPGYYLVNVSATGLC